MREISTGKNSFLQVHPAYVLAGNSRVTYAERHELVLVEVKPFQFAELSERRRDFAYMEMGGGTGSLFAGGISDRVKFVSRASTPADLVPPISISSFADSGGSKNIQHESYPRVGGLHACFCQQNITELSVRSPGLPIYLRR